MLKSNAQKKLELQNLLTEVVNKLGDNMPKTVHLLVKPIVRQIPEDTIDETLDGILDFLSASFDAIEKIRADEPEFLPSDNPETMTVIEFQKEKVA